MNKLHLALIALFLSVNLSAENTTTLINQVLKQTVSQYSELAKTAERYTNKLPKTFKNDSVEMVSSSWWTSGFFPGTLWYIYDASKDQNIKKLAEQFSASVERQKMV